MRNTKFQFEMFSSGLQISDKKSAINFLFLYTVILLGQLSLQGTSIWQCLGTILRVTGRCCDCHLPGRSEGCCYTSCDEQGSSHNKGSIVLTWETVLCKKWVCIILADFKTFSLLLIISYFIMMGVVCLLSVCANMCACMCVCVLSWICWVFLIWGFMFPQNFGH